MIEYYNKDTIRYCPYTALISSPRDFMHNSTFFKLMYVTSGQISVTIRSRGQGETTHTITAGDAIMITPKDYHRYIVATKSADYCHRDIYVFDPMMRDLCDSLSPSLYTELTENEYPLQYSISQRIIASLEEMLTPFTGNSISPELDELHKCIVSFFLGTYLHYKIFAKPYPKWLSDLLLRLKQEDFMIQPLEEIIATTNYSHGHVSREFRSYLGKTLKQYVNECKITFSTSLLTNPKYTLDQITERLNFSTQSNYIDLFKKQYSTTPAQWRKEYLTAIDTRVSSRW